MHSKSSNVYLLSCMSILITDFLSGVQVLDWSLVPTSLNIGVNVFQAWKNEAFQSCQLSTTLMLIDHSAPVFDCNTFPSNSLNDTHLLCMKDIYRIILLSENTVEIVSCANDLKWVLGMDQGNQSLYLSDDSIQNSVHNDEVSEIAFYMQRGSLLRIDSALFTSTGASSLRPLEMCEAFNALLIESSSSLPPFILITDNSWTRFDSTYRNATSFPWSLSYWMDFCGLTPTTVYTWEILPINSNDGTDDNYNNDGICSVKYVTNGRYIEGSKRKSVVCLSDVMDEEYQVLKGEWNERNEVQFISSFGLPLINSGATVDRIVSLQQSKLYFAEMTEVIRAFAMRNQGSTLNTALHIRSISSTLEPERALIASFERQSGCSSDGGTIQSTLIDMLLLNKEDTDCEQSWKELVNRLACLTSLWRHNGSLSLKTQLLRNDYEVLDAVQNLFLEEATGFIKNICDSGSSFWCSYNDATEELLTSLNIGENHILKYVDEILRRQRKEWVDITSFPVVDRSDEIERPKIYTLTDGDVYVLIYILPEHRTAADAIVSQLQAGAVDDEYMKRTAHVYIKYLIVPISITDEHSSYCSIQTDVCEKNALPSLRVVIDQAAHTITELVDVQDIVFVLVGIEALLAFPQPAVYMGTIHNNPKEFTEPYKGIVPNCMYGSSSLYRLAANIMVSCRDCRSGDSKSKSLWNYNFNAFVGVGRNVLTMLTEIRRHPLYPFSSDNTIRGILREYAWNHQLEVVLDRDNIAFDSELVAQIRQEDLLSLQMEKTAPLSELTAFADFKILFSSYFRNTSEGLKDVSESILVERLALVSTTASLIAIKDSNGTCVVSIENLNYELAKSFNDCLSNYKWFVGVFNLIVFVENAKGCAGFNLYADDLTYRFFLISRYAKVWNYYIKHEEYRHTAMLLKYYLRLIRYNSQQCEAGTPTCINVYGDDMPCHCSVHYLASMDRLVVALSTAQAALYQETGSYDDTIKAFRVSLNPEKYSVVRQRRQEWRQQRAVLQQKYAGGKVVSDEVKVHFATYASKSTPELDNLVLSANMAMIPLTIIGLGIDFRDYSNKINGYFAYLQTVNEDDIVVLVDAYDVLLLPRARQIGSVLAQSEAPIMFCAEAGIYPEFAGAFMYHRGSINSHHNEYNQQDHMTQKFLNSGCIAGRTGQLRHMFSFAHVLSYVFRDDQQVLVHYLLQNPDMITLDTDHQMFITTFKMGSVVSEDANWIMNQALQFSHRSRLIEGALQTRGSSSIGIIHCNNKANANFYNIYAQYLEEFMRLYYSGEDGPALLEAMNAMHDGHYSLAVERLNSDVVVRNRTSFGGFNRIGDDLMSLIDGIK